MSVLMAGEYVIRKAETKDAGGLFKMVESHTAYEKMSDDTMTITVKGHGYGLTLMQRVAKIAHEEGCIGMRWVVFGWNERAKNFYSKIKAENVAGSDHAEFMYLKGEDFIHLAQGTCST